MMQRAVVALIVAVVPLIAGCFEPAPGGSAPVERPDDWAQGVELVFVSGFRAHSADEERRIVPPDNATLPAPAYCGAYQDGIRKGYDSCVVRAPFEPEHRDRSWAWSIEAAWDGRGEDLVEQEQDESRRTVVAFDSGGHPVAFWDTAAHPDAAMAIE